MVTPKHDHPSPEPMKPFHEVAHPSSVPDKKKKKGKLEKKPPDRTTETAKKTLSDSENRPQSPTPSLTDHPRIPPLIQKDIAEHAKLFHSARKLTEATKTAPFSKKSTVSQSDVFFTEHVIFKRGEAATLNKMCSGIANLVGLGDFVPVSKAGTAGVVSENDLKQKYARQTNYKGEAVLVPAELKDAVQVEDVHIEEDGDETVGDEVHFIYDNVDVCLKRNGESGALVFHDPSIGEATLLETVADESNRFRLLKKPDEETYGLAQPDAIHEVLEGGPKIGDMVRINKAFYKVVEEKKTGLVRLEWLNIPQNKNTPEDGGVTRASFNRMEDGEDEVLVPNDRLFELEEKPEGKRGNLSFSFSGKDFKAKTMKDSADTYEIQVQEAEARENPLPFDNDMPLTIVRNHQGVYRVMPKSEELVIRHEAALPEATSKEPAEFIVRDGKEFGLIHKGDHYFIFDNQAKGLVQKRVKNIFTKPTGSKNDLNILNPSVERDHFFAKIDKQSYLKAFLLTMLLRPQDGKVSDLGESNVLFQPIPANANPQDPRVKLRPILIDMDEAMPQGNRYSENPNFTDKGKYHKVHCVRCGLMGFPQAREKLSTQEIAWLKEFASTLKQQEGEIISYLGNYLPKPKTRELRHVEESSKRLPFDEKNIKAFKDALEGIVAYIEKHPEGVSTLQELFFSVFPEYEHQWNMMPKNEDPALKASRIGNVDESLVVDARERR